MNLETLKSRLEGSKYDPVIWEDVKPLEEKIEHLEFLLENLIDILSGAEGLDDYTIQLIEKLQ